VGEGEADRLLAGVQQRAQRGRGADGDPDRHDVDEGAEQPLAAREITPTVEDPQGQLGSAAAKRQHSREGREERAVGSAALLPGEGVQGRRRRRLQVQPGEVAPSGGPGGVRGSGPVAELPGPPFPLGRAMVLQPRRLGHGVLGEAAAQRGQRLVLDQQDQLAGQDHQRGAVHRDVVAVQQQPAAPRPQVDQRGPQRRIVREVRPARLSGADPHRHRAILVRGRAVGQVNELKRQGLSVRPHPQLTADQVPSDSEGLVPSAHRVERPAHRLRLDPPLAAQLEVNPVARARCHLLGQPDGPHRARRQQVVCVGHEVSSGRSNGLRAGRGVWGCQTGMQFKRIGHACQDGARLAPTSPGPGYSSACPPSPP